MSDFETRYKTWHARLSYVKSSVRIGACGGAIWFSSEPALSMVVLSLGLMAAEVLGILEEII